jgi:hypothetical protein
MPVATPERLSDKIFNTVPRAGIAVTTNVFQLLEAPRIDNSAFLTQLKTVAQSGSRLPYTQQSDSERPNDAAIVNAQRVLLTLWRDQLVPSAILPAAEGGIGISFVAGQRQAHLEFSNDGDFSLVMFEPSGAIDVFNDDPTSENLAVALRRLRQYILFL